MRMRLPDSIKAALSGEESIYTPFLALALACESPTLNEVAQRCAALNTSSEQLNQAQASALAWVEELGI